MSWWDTAVGRTAATVRTFTADDLDAYAILVGAARRPDRVPEPLLAGMVSKLLGVDLPGPGTNYLKQQWHYLDAAPVGTPLTATVEITRVRPDKHLVDLATTITGDDGQVYAEGRALVLARDAVAATEP